MGWSITLCLQYWFCAQLQYIYPSFRRLYMTHGQAAHRPDLNRISECTCLKLHKEFTPARNRPRDANGKVLPIAQSIVTAYSHIKQLIEDCRHLETTNLVLVAINTTTVNSW